MWDPVENYLNGYNEECRNSNFKRFKLPGVNSVEVSSPVIQIVDVVLKSIPKEIKLWLHILLRRILFRELSYPFCRINRFYPVPSWDIHQGRSYCSTYPCSVRRALADKPMVIQTLLCRLSVSWTSKYFVLSIRPVFIPYQGSPDCISLTAETLPSTLPVRETPPLF